MTLNFIRVSVEKFREFPTNKKNEIGIKLNKKIEKRYFIYIKTLLGLEFKMPIYPNFNIEVIPYLDFPAAR